MEANPFSVESAAANAPTVEQSATPPADNGQASIPAAAPKKQTTDADKWKFRFKFHRSKLLKQGKSDSEASALATEKAGPKPDGASVPAVSTAPSAVSPVASASPALAVVPWNPAAFKPLVSMLTRAGEKATIGRLVRIARQIPDSAALVAKIEQDAAWNPEAKEILFEVGPSVAARWAHKLGLPAETAEDVAVVAAVGMIASGYITLANELAEMASKAQQKKADAQPRS